MNKTKWIPAVLLVAALASACGNNQKSTDAPATATQEPKQEQAQPATQQTATSTSSDEKVVQNLTTPQEIIVYKQGSKQVVKPEDELFKTIFTLTNKRLINPGYVMRFDESNEAVTKTVKEGLAVEFKYEQSIKNTIPAFVGGENNQEINAKSILFIVDGENKNLMFYSEDGKNYGTAPIEYPESVELNDLLKK
ncbi:hypothetical protein O0550_12885 [Brevibacillus halotolerans]|uniref:hypothetical protein n=1 Tax=Brevibacillus TaxID=55080 RepID=UPI00215C276E|nr:MULTISPECIES: hypothetical protein [Brevibacillus]MCR8964089.1 hypothetical protein [Brevibacillus laterosporus]MCZ0836244.1 hypothetical protein [Brevibacillus halotolerans]